MIFALRSGGSSTTVAPIVFAIAPIVNVIISWVLDLIAGKAQLPEWQFYVGILLAAAGVFLILAYNPAAHGAKPAGAKPTGAVAVSGVAAPH